MTTLIGPKNTRQVIGPRIRSAVQWILTRLPKESKWS